MQSSNTCGLFFDHYFNFLSAKTEINKNELNLIDGLEDLKRRICGYVICRTSQLLFEATLSYFSIVAVLYNFRDLRVFAFGYRTQNENPDTARENFYYSAFSSQSLSNSLLCLSFFIFVGRICNSLA